MFHLSDLLNPVSEEDLQDSGCPAVPPNQTQVLPLGTKQAARTVLHQLLQAWVSSVLPGYDLRPRKYPKKKGRPSGMEPHERMRRLDECNELREKLNEIESESVEGLARKQGEPAVKYLIRIASFVERLHHTSILLVLLRSRVRNVAMEEAPASRGAPDARRE